MPQTKSQRKPPARKPAARKPSAAPRRVAGEPSRTQRARAAAGEAADLSQDVLKSIESGQRAAIEAVEKFVDTVDRALPSRGEGPSRRQDVIDAALEMADRLVHTQYEFLHKVVHSAGKTLREPNGKK